MRISRVFLITAVTAVAMISCDALLNGTTGDPENVLSGRISEDRTLLSGIAYIVEGELRVSAELTIPPGTRLLFEEGAELRIESGGVLIAAGTEEQPIRFRGTTQEPGWWNGIVFYGSTSLNNTLEWVLIEHGGREAIHGSVVPANLVVGYSLRDGRVRVENSTIRHSGGYGVAVHENGTLTGWSNNTVTQNASAPVWAAASHAHLLDAESKYTGNDVDAVRLVANRVEEGSVTWQALDVPYRVTGGGTNIDVRSGLLSIEPGAVLLFEEDGGLKITGTAEIVVEGTADERVTFSGTQETPGWWNGIWVRTDSTNNSLDYVTVEYGGRDEFHSSLEPANIAVGRSITPTYDSFVSITNSIIQSSGGYGLHVHGNSEVNADVESANEFAANANDDVRID